MYTAATNKSCSATLNISQEHHSLDVSAYLALCSSARDAGDMGSIPGSVRPSSVENGNPLHYSCLKNSMDREVWQAAVHGVAKSGHY